MGLQRALRWGAMKEWDWEQLWEASLGPEKGPQLAKQMARR